jgi:AraC family transcriptional regulator
VSQICVLGSDLAEVCVLVNENAMMPNPFGAPERTSAAAFPRYSSGEVLADSASLQWPGLFVRRSRFPRTVDRFLVPATPEPLVSCVLAGSAEFQERDIGGAWLPRQVRRGDIFVTGSKTPYELRWRSPLGEETEVIHIHLAVDQCLAAFEMVYHDKAGAVEVTDFYGRDETLVYLSFACAEMLSARTAGNAKRVAAFAHLLAIHIAEKYTNIASQRPDYRGGLPIARLRKIEDYVHAHLAESISVEALAELVELSPFHFSRVFKHATGMSPLQFVTRERIVRAQQLVRETSRSLIEIALEVGYTSPSHFAQVFRRVVGVAPTEFRAGL